MKNFKNYLEEKFRFTLKYHSRLNPKLWHNSELKPGISDRLMKLAYKFAEFSGIDKKKIKDIIMTGSNVNFNYVNSTSDIDIHLLCDLTNYDDEELYHKKVEWTNSHSDTEAGYPLEFYAADVSEILPNGQGFYSILNNTWVLPPDHLDHIEALEDQFVIDKIEHNIKYIKQLVKSGTIEQIDKYKAKLHDMRTAGLHDKGEFSVENVLYKEIRNRKYIDKLNARYQVLKSLKEA